MEPLSALSVAAAAIQFADFGSRLLKNALQIYSSSSNQTAQSIQLSTVSHDLTSLIDDLELKLYESQNVGQLNETFLRLCRECKETNTELQAILDKLQARGSNKISLAASSLLVAFKQVAAADEVDRLTNRLDQIRQQIMVALLSQLLGEAQNQGVDLLQLAKQQAGLAATLDRVDQNTKNLCTDVVALVDARSPKNRSEIDEMVRYVMSDKWDAAKHTPGRVDENRDHAKLDRILHALFFDSMSNREASIPKTYSKTFDWIFSDPLKSDDDAEQPLWDSFPAWLRGGSRDIYWITGKPGAGKSTLTKFVAADPRLKQHLKVWAGRSELLVARFFSWTAGMNRLQKTHEGLLRTILLEFINNKPQLVATIFPARWFLLQSFDSRAIRLPPLGFPEMVAGFRKLIHATGERLKLALIIDGLDEFEEDHHELVRLLREAAAGPGVKVCVSSRPWNVFKDAYSKNPMLQLETLTREDIKMFVREKLELSPGYKAATTTAPQAARKVLNDIVDKADGVFLWVSVVTGLLEGGFQEGARISDLQKIVDGLPSEVSHLFRYIWDRTSKKFKAEACQYFQVMRACKEMGMQLYGLTLWFGDSDVSVDSQPPNMTGAYLTGIAEYLERRLMGRTGGLLELFYGNGEVAQMRVDFMHRTASDWVRDNWNTMVEALDDVEFDEWLWILKGEVLSFPLRAWPLPMTDELGHIKFIFKAAARIRYSDPKTTATIVATLDRFDQYLNGDWRDGRNTKLHWTPFLRWCFGPRSDQTYQFAKTLAISACMPITPYVRHQVEKNPRNFKNIAVSSRVFEFLVFGELRHSTGNGASRLDLLRFLLGFDDGCWAEHLRSIKDRAIKSGQAPKDKALPQPYLNQVIDLLEEHLSGPVEPTPRTNPLPRRSRNVFLCCFGR